MASPVCEEIERLEAALDDLCQLDAYTLSSPEAVITLARLSGKFEYVETKVLTEFDASGEWKADGAKTPTAFENLPRGRSASIARNPAASGKPALTKS